MTDTPEPESVSAQLTKAKKSRKALRNFSVVVVLLAILSIGGYFGYQAYETPRREARQTVADFELAWEEDALQRVTFTEPDTNKVVSDYRAVVAALGPVKPTVDLRSTSINSARTTARYAVSWPVESKTWSYETTVTFRRVDDLWRTEWSPTLVHPDMRDGGKLVSERVPSKRAEVLLAGGAVAPADVARSLVGTVGPATAEMVQKANGRLVAGDNAGLSGLQAQFDAQLSGTPGKVISIEHAGIDGAAPAREAELTIEPVAGVPVQTTLDDRVQRAAQAALAPQPKPSALIAIKASTGEILATANGPSDGGGFNRGFLGQYPPGSSFKVVSTLALLQKGVTANEVVNCPKTINVGGQTFKNAKDEVLGSVPFHVDFAHSCNTAFSELSKRLSNTDLTTTGEQVGIGKPWNVGLPTYTGSIPHTAGAADRASSTFGQGRILVSPLSMANVAASVASGSWTEPRLVVGSGIPPATPAPLPAGTAETLRSLMREVVTSGTGDAVRNVRGGPVHGKTGTAEYGTKLPLPSHAWFVGFQNDIAFAVFVEGGEFGGETAAPIAARFLNSIAP